MKLIKAIIRTNNLEAVRAHLIARGIFGMTVNECVGHGKQAPTVRSLKCDDKELSILRPMTSIEVAVPSEQSDIAIAAITNGARLAEKGDGKIFVSALDQVVRIRTGERDIAALVSSLEEELTV